MRLIDADELMMANHWGKLSGKAYKEVIGVIATSPTVDSEPVVHAHWIDRKELDLCECSRCGRRELHYYANDESVDPAIAYPYCHCGAKMDEEVSEDA